MPAPPRGPRRNNQPTAALFVRIPTEQANRLDRAAFALGRPKQDLVATLLERYVDPDSPDALAELTWRAGAGAGAPASGRRVTIEELDSSALTVGHHSFRPREPEVLTLEEVAELLQVPVPVVEQLARDGELPARQLGGEWRTARRALLDWLAAGGQSPDPSRTAAGPRDTDR